MASAATARSCGEGSAGANAAALTTRILSIVAWGSPPHGRGANRDLATNSVLGTVGAPFIDVGNGTGVLAANRLMGCLMGTNLTVPGFQFRKLFQLCLIQALSILYAGIPASGYDPPQHYRQLRDRTRRFQEMFEMKVIHPKMAGEGHPQLRLPSQRKAQERAEAIDGREAPGEIIMSADWPSNPKDLNRARTP